MVPAVDTGGKVPSALAVWLRADPQLKVLGAVVVADAVEVVDSLPLAQLPSDYLFHDRAVLGDVLVGGGLRLDADVALFVEEAVAVVPDHWQTSFDAGVGAIPPRSPLRGREIAPLKCLLASNTNPRFYPSIVT